MGRPRKCSHAQSSWERCKDGMICLTCNEGVCPCCRKLWAETRTVDQYGDTEIGPNCLCDGNTDEKE